MMDEKAPPPAEEPSPEGEKPEQLEVSPGDRVRITPEAMIDPEAQDATPVRLFKFGWPNDFLVVDVYEDKRYGQVLTLDPCCNWIKDPEKRKENVCVAHASRFFEVIKRSQSEANRRYSGVNIAGLDILSVEFLNGKEGEQPSLAVRVAGRKPMVLQGQAAHILSQFLRAQKVF